MTCPNVGRSLNTNDMPKRGLRLRGDNSYVGYNDNDLRRGWLVARVQQSSVCAFLRSSFVEQQLLRIRRHEHESTTGSDK
jgi:hypothetical protein